MKTTLKLIGIALAFLAVCGAHAIAQKKPLTEKEYFTNKFFDGSTMVDTTRATPAQWVRIRNQQRIQRLTKERYYFNPMGNRRLGIRFDTANKSAVYEGLKRYTDQFSYTTSIIKGSTSVEIIAQDIDPAKAGNYRYEVIRNNTRIVAAQQPTDFRTSKDGKSIYAYLGKFAYVPAQVLKVRIWHIKNYLDQDGTDLDWRPLVAAQVSGWIQYVSPRVPMPGDYILSNKLTERKRTTDRHVYYENGKIVFRDVPYHDMLETTDTLDPKFRLSDTIQNLRFGIENGKRLYNYRITLKRDIDGTMDSLNLGESNDIFYLYKEFWRRPGVYHLTFTPKIKTPGGQPIFFIDSLSTTVKFTTLPPLDEEKKLPLKTVAMIVLIILTTAGFMFMMYRDSQKRKLKRQAQEKQVTALKLQSVRSQLNPHFIFNALAGIQNLMNKNAIEDANKYLSKFARLTRNVLDDSNQEFIPIEKEIDLLTDYLQMEQMRFGFKYNLTVADDIDRQTEMPGMLLQPFVENAVKHGVSSLKDKGQIAVAMNKQGSNLILTVQDNGSGFSEHADRGMGTRLCEDRIKLLNSMYKETLIVMQTTSGQNGTTVTIELQNWIS